MKLSRRSLLQAAALGSAITPVGVRAALGEAPAMIVWDSRLPASRAFAMASSAPLLDVAKQHGNLWSDLRTHLATAPVSGLTRWSDYVSIRSELEARGYRQSRITRTGQLFRWDMVHRMK